MNNIINIFYHSNTDVYHPSFLQNFSFLLLFIILIIGAFHYKHYLNHEKISLIIKRTLLFTLIIQQLLLYSWYYFNQQFSLKDALPLYPCRISELFCIILLIHFNEKLFDFLYFWGILGAGIALFSPDTSGAGFPNAMFLQFYLGHICIILTIVYTLLKHNIIINKNSLATCSKSNIVYFMVVILTNHFLGSNYGYLHGAPENLAFLNKVPIFLYISLYMILIQITFYLMCLPFKKSNFLIEKNNSC